MPKVIINLKTISGRHIDGAAQIGINVQKTENSRAEFEIPIGDYFIRATSIGYRGDTIYETISEDKEITLLMKSW